MRIHVVAPAGPVNEARLVRGMNWLRAQGHELIEGKHLRDTWGHLAGRDQERADDLMHALCDESAELVWAARGGFGCARLLPLLDWQRLETVTHAPMLVGYSDLTALQLALWTQLSWNSLHAPMVATEVGALDPLSAASLAPWLRGERTPMSLDLREGQVLAGGCARGSLLGGNFSVLTSLLGSPWFPQDEELVLFLEDHGEYPFRMDRYLAQLRNSGVLARTRAILLGHFNNCVEPDAEKSTFSLAELFEQYFLPLGIPVIQGLPFGHAEPRLSLLQGATALVDTERRLLQLQP